MEATATSTFEDAAYPLREEKRAESTWPPLMKNEGALPARTALVVNALYGGEDSGSDYEV